MLEMKFCYPVRRLAVVFFPFLFAPDREALGHGLVQNLAEPCPSRLTHFIVVSRNLVAMFFYLPTGIDFCVVR